MTAAWESDDHQLLQDELRIWQERLDGRRKRLPDGFWGKDREDIGSTTSTHAPMNPHQIAITSVSHPCVICSPPRIRIGTACSYLRLTHVSAP